MGTAINYLNKALNYCFKRKNDSSDEANSNGDSNMDVEMVSKNKKGQFVNNPILIGGTKY